MIKKEPTRSNLTRESPHFSRLDLITEASR